MKLNLTKYLNQLVNLNYFLKRFLLLTSDFLIIYFSIIFAYLLRFDQIIFPSNYIISLFFITYFFSNVLLKSYNFSLRFLEFREYIKTLLKATALNILFLFAISYLLFIVILILLAQVFQDLLL